jgi:deoxycytidylate deaminase
MCHIVMTSVAESLSKIVHTQCTKTCRFFFMHPCHPCTALILQRCYVRITNYEVCEESGATKQEARDIATRRAVEILRENCYTIW